MEEESGEKTGKRKKEKKINQERDEGKERKLCIYFKLQKIK